MTATANVVVSRITLFSADMDKTAEFYNAIGLNLEKSVHGWGPYYSYLDVLEGNGIPIIFEIYSLRQGQTAGHQNLGFDVANLSEVIKNLKEIGAFLMRPLILIKRPELCDRCTSAAFQDPDGREVSLTQHSYAKPA